LVKKGWQCVDEKKLSKALFEFFLHQIAYGGSIVQEPFLAAEVTKEKSAFVRAAMVIYYMEQALLGTYEIIYWRPYIKLDRDHWMTRFNRVLTLLLS
jgi:hypothetical protein